MPAFRIFCRPPRYFGTFGAFIRIRSPIYTRGKGLFDIGIKGPIAGFLVLLPFFVWGICLSKTVPLVTVHPRIRSCFWHAAPCSG